MRIVTRGDFDGLASSVLLFDVEQVDEIALIHPQDITDRKFPVRPTDILVNLPYDPNCAMWFDHHEHTIKPDGNSFKGSHAKEFSVAKVIFDHYKSPKHAKYKDLVEDANRFDSAKLTQDEVLDPQGSVLLGFLIDPRTGMGTGYKDFFMHLVKRLRTKTPVELLKEADLMIRTSRYKSNIAKFQEFLLANSEVDNNVVITDFRDIQRAPIGNRFLVYVTHPQCNVSVRIQWGPGRSFVAVNLGHSIFDRSSQVDVGRLCREHGGGGHRGAGACVLDPAHADLEIQEIIEQLVEHE